MPATVPTFDSLSISPELRILIQEIGMATKVLTKADFTYFSDINLDRLKALASIHRIRPLLKAMLQREGISQLSPQSSQPTIKNIFRIRKNLTSILCFKEIALKLEEQQIPVMLLKGNLYIDLLYQNNQLRESGDLDILVPKEYVLEAVKILHELNFKIYFIPVHKEINEGQYDFSLEFERLKKKLNSPYFCEITLMRGSELVDLHWGFNQALYAFDYNPAGVFERSIEYNFHGLVTRIPCPEDLLLSMVLHHGGKEQWVSLRHIQDFLNIILKYQQEFDWDKLLKMAMKSNLLEPLLSGCKILDDLFGIKIPEVLSISNENQQFTVGLVALWDIDDQNNYQVMKKNIFGGFKGKKSILQKIKFFHFNYVNYQMSIYPAPLEVKKFSNYLISGLRNNIS
ncbi:nucleotidyltransferase domain-containing protein [Mongoliitalea lutea]|uniref:Nucleotidyltransferase family protein n=1 Tax=Mongoliitalea lutea TaxID=849756 RepID=A0A8J3CYT8_9BACT|nr:nucleotidyltransferase family protein [Mongoliitalea lutea]GHB36935.1 hypothetical protein GCM10008106_17770 [Mongoliitalea lutea]